MRRKTKKLSGPAKDRFLSRLLATEPAVPHDTAERLARRGAEAISSLRVRRTGWSGIKPCPVVVRDAPAKPAEPPPGTPPSAPPAETFDPYTVALVPVMQREGHDGLVARLVAIGDPDKLRLMARSQQIALPPEVRTGTIASDRLAEAIADAVAKRIADRKAAAR